MHGQIYNREGKVYKSFISIYLFCYNPYTKIDKGKAIYVNLSKWFKKHLNA